MAKIKFSEDYINGLIAHLDGVELSEHIIAVLKDIESYQYDYLQTKENGVSILENYNSFSPDIIKTELDRIKAEIQQYNVKTDEIVEEAYKMSKPIIQQQVKSKFLPYLRQLIEMSNNIDASLTGETSQENITKYEAACMLKCFVVEFSSKILHILSNEEAIRKFIKIKLLKTEGRNIPNKNQKVEVIAKRLLSENLTGENKETAQFKFVNSLVGEIKDTERVLEEVRNSNIRRITGHEIEIMFNSLPDTIRNFVKYKTMTSFVIPDITKKGQIPTKSKFFQAPDFLIMVKNFSEEEINKLNSNNSLMNERLKSNNSGFINYRYLQQQADIIDYEVLNAIAISLYETLDFSTKNIITFQDNIPTDYESLKSTFTLDEYNNLISLYKENPNSNLDSIISYYAFMKTYVDIKEIDINDKKYTNINNFFQKIKESNDITSLGEIFSQWYSSIDLATLTKEELDELQIIDPTFIYNSLSYTDKLIYQKCKAQGIKFSYYYKLNLDTFEFILNSYASSFQNKQIGENCIITSAHTLKKIEEILKEKGLNIGDVPDYYFKYDPNILKMIYRNEENNIVPEEYFIKRELSKKYDIEYREIVYSSVNYQERIDRLREYEEKLAYLEKSKKEQAERIIQLINSGADNQEQLVEITSSLDKEFMERIMIMAKIVRITKITDITQLLTKTSSQLKEQIRQLSLKESNTSDEIEINGNLGQLYDVVEFTENVPVSVHMKFLTIIEVKMNYTKCLNYAKRLCADLDDFDPLPIGEYLLHSTPEQVSEIIKLCEKHNLKQFEPELLYFNPEELKQLGGLAMNLVPQFIQNIKTKNEREGTKFTYEDAESILERVKETAFMLQGYMQQTNNNELNEMFEDKKETHPLQIQK